MQGGGAAPSAEGTLAQPKHGRCPCRNAAGRGALQLADSVTQMVRAASEGTWAEEGNHRRPGESEKIGCPGIKLQIGDDCVAHGEELDSRSTRQ